MKHIVKCTYCGQPAVLVQGSAIYTNAGPILSRKWFWRCDPCDAHVGTHSDGKALGKLANKELRAARVTAHASFDRLWKYNHMTRSDAYKWLSEIMGLPPEQTHIALFGPVQCKHVTLMANAKLEEMGCNF